MRSAWSKLGNIATDMEMRSMDLCFLTEVWQQTENKRHQQAIEELLELKGIKYVSTPRPGARRGGGTAFACSEERFTLTKLNIAIPRPLEACFALLKPKNPTGKTSKFICCCFYSPPASPHRNKLAEFVVATIGQLRGEHPWSRVFVAGDRNDLKIQVFSSLDPTLKQLVQGVTNKNNDRLLDVIFTDSHDIMQQPVILPPMQVDTGKEGKDSDHKGVECLPRTTVAQTGGQVREKILVRRFPESKIVDFGFKLVDQDWADLKDSMDSTELVDTFVKISVKLVEDSFPQKEILVGPEDKPYFTEELRQLKKRRQRAYRRYGKRSNKYIQLEERFSDRLKHEAFKYQQKIVSDVREGKRSSAYKAIRKLGNRPGEQWKRPAINLPTYTEQNLTPLQAANKLATYFSTISQTVEPLDERNFPPSVQLALQRGR